MNKARNAHPFTSFNFPPYNCFWFFFRYQHNFTVLSKPEWDHMAKPQQKSSFLFLSCLYSGLSGWLWVWKRSCSFHNSNKTFSFFPFPSCTDILREQTKSQPAKFLRTRKYFLDVIDLFICLVGFLQYISSITNQTMDFSWQTRKNVFKQPISLLWHTAGEFSD